MRQLIQSISAILAVLSILVGAPPSASQSKLGQLQGTVLDEMNRPIAAASVHLAQKGLPTVGHHVIHTYETNDDGKYAIDNIPWGTYVVLAGKEEAGYPDTQLAFYSNLDVPTVTLSPTFPSATVNLLLGPKAGYLLLRSVVDAQSGKGVQRAQIVLRRTKAPNFFMRTAASPGAKIAVPSSVPISIEILADGYQPWHNGLTQKMPLQLKASEIRELSVKLDRALQ